MKIAFETFLFISDLSIIFVHIKFSVLTRLPNMTQFRPQEHVKLHPSHFSQWE